MLRILAILLTFLICCAGNTMGQQNSSTESHRTTSAPLRRPFPDSRDCRTESDGSRCTYLADVWRRLSNIASKADSPPSGEKLRNLHRAFDLDAEFVP